MAETATSTIPTHSEQPTASNVIERNEATSDSFSVDKKDSKAAADTKDLEAAVVQDDTIVEENKGHSPTLYRRFRPLILGGFALLILAWWISATILKATRHRWVVQTVLAWSFISIIAFRFIPNSVVTRPIAAVW
jgi:concentrative nucleoside transporter, CNT family